MVWVGVTSTVELVSLSNKTGPHLIPQTLFKNGGKDNMTGFWGKYL